MTGKRRRRVALNLTASDVRTLGVFMHFAGQALGHSPSPILRDECRAWWGRMSTVARAAVIRLGLKPRLVAAGCIPADG